MDPTETITDDMLTRFSNTINDLNFVDKDYPNILRSLQKLE